ncbi:MAG: CDP-alcohol phosphatidyltransferase family protein [Deltaproteobacteria bacterium]|nr:CDP-alcohol phosphatidyltransferase family protein [Deltaproteobacteria bacterium]
MLDKVSLRLLSPYLEALARFLRRRGIKPDQVSVAGFIVGMVGVGAIALGHNYLALIFILLNRTADGLDGALARLTETTDSGAFLDISLDFVFYSAVIFGFALADPARNGLAAAALIFSFVGTGSSFLAFAVLAERRHISDLRLPGKGIYYLGGLAEGTETIVFFILICLFPVRFPILAWIFATICYLTTGLRIFYGYRTLRADQRNQNLR